MEKADRIAVVSGGFDPVHSGHIHLFQSAAELFERKIVVLLNSDEWLTRKKGKPFLPVEERKIILEAMSMVDRVVLFDDSNNSCCDGLERVKQLYPMDTVVFCNGGDRTKENIPEMQVDGIEFKFGIGGEDKRGSSSDFLSDWKGVFVKRPWGGYRVIYNDPTNGQATKVKELVVEPGQSLSMQKHESRHEYWHIVSGMCDVYGEMHSGYNLPPRTISAGQHYVVPVGEWHRISNPFSGPCKIVEIQHGSVCDENDIVRRNHQLTYRS